MVFVIILTQNSYNKKEEIMDDLKKIKKEYWTSTCVDFFKQVGAVFLAVVTFAFLVYLCRDKSDPKAEYFEADGHEYVIFPGYCSGCCHSPECKCLQKPESKPIKNKNRVVKTTTEGTETYVLFPAEVVK